MLRKHDDYIICCPCGFFGSGFFSSIRSCKVARTHVNRSRKPGHVAYVINVSKMEVVARYLKGQVQTEMLDQPDF